MPLITEDGVPHTLRAGDDSLTPKTVRRYSDAAGGPPRVAVFACVGLATMFGFRGVWGLAIIMVILAIPCIFIARAIDLNKAWARRGGIVFFSFVGGVLILSVVVSARTMIAAAGESMVATILTLGLVSAAGVALCYFPHRWFAPPK